MIDMCHLLRLVDGCEVEGSVASVGALVHVAGVLQQPLQQSLVIVLGSEESQNTETIGHSIHLGCPVQRGVAGVGVRQGEQAGRGRHQPGQGRVLAQ